MRILSNLDLRQNQLLQAVIENLAQHPSNPKLGQIYYNTVDEKFYGYTEHGVWADLTNVYDDTAIMKRLTEIEEQLKGSSLEGHRHDAEDVDFKAEMLTVSALGGIGVGENLNGLSVQDVLTKLLYPYVEPVVNVTTTPNGGTFEFGNRQNVTNVAVTVAKKSEVITKIELLDGSNSLGVQEGDPVANGGTFNFALTQEVATSGKYFTVKVTDKSGKVVSKNTNSFTFVYPYYTGVVAADKTQLTEDDIKAMTKKIEAKGNKSVSYTVNNERMVFAYPKSHGVLKTIIDPNGFDNFGAFSRAEISITGLDGTAQAYYVYVNGASTNTNFNMKFNY